MTSIVMNRSKPESAPVTGRRALVVAMLGALFLVKLAGTLFFHKYDWDILEVVFLPIAHGQPVESDPYSFLLSSLLGLLGQWSGAVTGFHLLTVLANLLYVASGVLIFRIVRRWTGSPEAAVVGAAVFLSSYAIVYVSSYLDDNIFQAFFVVLALWALLRKRPRLVLAGICYGLSCAFHLQSFALAPAFAVGAWTLSSGGRMARARKVAECAGIVALVYGALLLLFVDVGQLLAVIGGAASHGPGAFVVSQDDAGLAELLVRGMVATLLPFPIHIRAIFDRPSLYVLVLGLGLIYVGAAVAVAAAAAAGRLRPGSQGSPWLLVSLAGFASGAVFALIAEPDGTERWVSVAPFFALCAGAAVSQIPRLRSISKRPVGRAAAYGLAAFLVLFTVFPGKLLAFALFGGERQVVTSGMIQELKTTFAGTDLVVLDEGFEALSLYRPQSTCYTVFEYWTDNIKCWGPAGVSHRDRADPGYLEGARTIAMQKDLPDLDAVGIVEGETVEICDPGLLARAFGRGRCVTLEVGAIRIRAENP